MPGHEGFSLDDWIQWGQLDLLGRLQLPAGRAMAPLSRQFVIDVGDTRGGITWWPYTYHPGAQSWDGCLQAFIELDDVRNHLVQLEAFVRAYGVLGFCEHPVPDDEPTLPYSVMEECRLCAGAPTREAFDAWDLCIRQAKQALIMAARMKRPDYPWLPSALDLNALYRRPIFCEPVPDFGKLHPEMWKRRCWSHVTGLANSWIPASDVKPEVWFQPSDPPHSVPRFNVSAMSVLGNLGLQLAVAFVSRRSPNKHFYECAMCHNVFQRDTKLRKDAKQAICPDCMPEFERRRVKSIRDGKQDR